MSDMDIQAAVTALYQAMLAHDTTALAALLTEDVRYGHSPGFVEGKAAYLDGVRDGLYEYEHVQPTEQHVMRSGDLAVVYDVLDFRGGPRGQPHPPVRLITTLVWRREAGAWRLAIRQATRMP
jgi:uncharacterized protein (TIGR02246 family)